MLEPIPGFSRLIVTGNDRAKYLHNFCTNNIKELPCGSACEAFFCDVKARIIAHGYVLAFDDCHEIWTLAGDEAGLLKHLNRYIITEDVTITSATDSTSAFAAIGAASIRMLLDELDDTKTLQQPLTSARLQLRIPDDCASADTVLTVEWADTPLLWLVTSKKSGDLPVTKVTANETPTFEQLRIRERYPIINQDLSIENMAPEADRNSDAISYVKGCYLGQEPIARLDAMGHVNRALRCVQSALSAEQLFNANILAQDDTIVGMVTSATFVEHGSIGLALIRNNVLQRPLRCLIDGQSIEVKV